MFAVPSDHTQSARPRRPKNSGTDPEPQSKPKKTSALFDDPTADVVFQSSDDVLFRIHRQHLDATTAGFAIPALISPDNSPAELTESAEILEILFQFIKPCTESNQYRQPWLMTMNPQTLFAVAEAAEKYIVFGAMNTFITRMHDKQICDTYPIEVLNHCGKHGYPDLASVAAYEALSRPLDKIVEGLTHPGLLGKWILYYNRWLQLAQSVQNRLPSGECEDVANIKLKYLAETMSNISYAGRVSECYATNRIGKCRATSCLCRNVGPLASPPIPPFTL